MSLPDSPFPHQAYSDEGIRAGKIWGPQPACPPGHTWHELMGRGLDLARLGATRGEVPVGALVVTAQGHIVGEGHNETHMACDPSAHAEVVALRRAALATGNYRLGQCILVVTLEPCMMCTGAMREARLAGVVYGAEDARAGALVSRLEGLEIDCMGPPVWHYGGVRAQEAVDLLQHFFQTRR